VKRVVRLDEPVELEQYRGSNPQSSWEQMRNDATGRVAYEAVRRQLLEGQGGLCGFCELGLHDHDPLKCRVEHFHPKSDTSTPHNWALDWQNVIVVCMGGSQRYLGPPHTLEPLPENLSCDAHKDQMIKAGRLTEQCEGWIVAPVDIPHCPCLFFLEKSTGRLEPDELACANVTFPDNRHASTEALVLHTITMLNLNCTRLCEARKRILWHIERSKKKLRDSGAHPDEALQALSERYFRQRWPAFFTTIRFCLGPAAEKYLADVEFQG